MPSGIHKGFLPILYEVLPYGFIFPLLADVCGLAQHAQGHGADCRFET